MTQAKPSLTRLTPPYQLTRTSQVPNKPKHEVEERWPSHPQASGQEGRSGQTGGVQTCDPVPTVLQPAQKPPDHRMRKGEAILEPTRSPDQVKADPKTSSLLGTWKQRDSWIDISTLAAVSHGKSAPLRRSERLRMAAALRRNSTYQERADRMVECCSVWGMVHVPRNHPEKARPVPSLHCRDRLCPECNRARGAKIVRKITPAIEEAKSQGRIVAMLTLTQVDRSGEPLKLARKRFNGSLAKMLRSAPWKRHVAGALIFREATYNRAEVSWHFHAHILLQTPLYWERDDIQALWMRLSPGAWNVDIRAAEPGVEAELAKYGTKSVDFEAEQVLEYAAAMAGARLVTGSGEWKSALTEEELEDPSEELDEGEELYHLAELVAWANAGDAWAQKALTAVDKWIWKCADMPVFPGQGYG